MARVLAVECERSVCAVVPLCCVGVLGHAAAFGTGVEGLGTRSFRVFLLIPIYYYYDATTDGYAPPPLETL